MDFTVVTGIIKAGRYMGISVRSLKAANDIERIQKSLTRHVLKKGCLLTDSTSDSSNSL